MAFTGTCTTEMCGVGNGLREYGDLNCEVYGISGDNPFSQEAWAQKEKINVTLLSDYEHKVTNDYGVAYDSFLPQLNLGFAGVAKRAAFLIDRDGRGAIRRGPRRRAGAAKFRQDQSEAGGAEVNA